MSNLTLTPLKDWGFNFQKPIIISGPCSCETEEQMTETAQRLANKGIDVLRAGIWKPRTRPGMFEGIGKEGLEIADVLKGVDIPVLVKNPINPDLQLWLGSMERLNAVGITKLGAIHRGFSSYEKSKYRNKPMWELPVEMRRLYPNMPIIVDPSHICGARELIPSVCQKALDLDFDGLMIESHRDPDNAWSDAAQQVTPERLGEIIAALIVRSSKLDDYAENQLESLRAQIDRIDNYMLEIMGERMDIARKIGEFKRDNGITILQTNRWDEIINDRIKKAAKKELTEDFVKDLMEAVHQESIRHQTRIMNNILAE